MEQYDLTVNVDRASLDGVVKLIVGALGIEAPTMILKGADVGLRTAAPIA